jgi:PAS domain S-box-containing protein
MNPPPPAERRPAWGLRWVFGLLVAGITLGGLLYHRHRQAVARSTARAEIEAIADLKIQQIVNWRKERLADANLIRGTPSLALDALNALAQPESANTRQLLTAWLDPLLKGGPYERILLLDDKLDLHLVHPEGGSGTLSSVARAAAEAALRTRQVVVTDLHRSGDGRQVYLNFAVPLVVRRVGTNDNAPADRSAGVLVLKLNAYDFLFPLIQNWPTVSRTAETLLVRREGQEVLYLNELRHQPGTAMNLRHPLSEARLPAAMGLRGEKVRGEGVDYRGVRVVPAVRPVPDTPWVMVAKVDVAFTIEQAINFIGPEARPSVQAAVQAALDRGTPWDLEVPFITAKGRHIWLRSQGSALRQDGKVVKLHGAFQDITVRKQVEAELGRMRKLLLEGQRIAHLGSWEYIAETQETLWSEEQLRIYGLNPAEPSPDYQVMLRDHIHPDDAARLDETFRQCLQDRAVFELDHRLVRPDGSVRVVQEMARPYFDGHGTLVKYVGTTLDITERNRAEEIARQQTAELQARNEELERFNRATTGRELRVIELKQQVDDLAAQLGRPRPYPLAFLDAAAREIVRTACESSLSELTPTSNPKDA